MESNQSVLNSIQRDDWLVSMDMKDAYFHIPIHQQSRKYLRFVFHGKNYQFRALCFGIIVVRNENAKARQRWEQCCEQWRVGGTCSVTAGGRGWWWWWWWCGGGGDGGGGWNVKAGGVKFVCGVACVTY